MGTSRLSPGLTRPLFPEGPMRSFLSGQGPAATSYRIRYKRRRQFKNVSPQISLNFHLALMSLHQSRPLRRNPERLVPSDNLEVYRMLYAMENGLRELIIEELGQVSGPRWYKIRLPGDLLKKYKEGLDVQKLTKWTNLVPHHPIYHLDFPDLRKIIERDDNWRDAFQRLFSRKDIVGTALSEIESIRNATAHNRRVSENDRILVESAFNKLANCVGNERLEAIVLTTLTAGILQDSLESLKTEAEVAL
jgi:Swt1-like HEPN